MLFLKLAPDAIHYTKGPCAADPTCLLIIAYVLPGHVYPVVESWDTWEGTKDGEIHWMNCGSNTMQPRDGYSYRGLMGSACKQGYQSHYCLVHGFDWVLFYLLKYYSPLLLAKKFTHAVQDLSYTGTKFDELITFNEEQSTPKYILQFNHQVIGTV